jgi:hypothetical protein
MAVMSGLSRGIIRQPSLDIFLLTKVLTGCYSPYSFSSHLLVLVLMSYSSPVGTILLRLVSLHVPHRVHRLFPFPLVTDLTPFSELPTGRGLIRSPLLTLFLLTYLVLSLGHSYLLSRFSRIGSSFLLLIRFHGIPYCSTITRRYVLKAPPLYFSLYF